jgi:glycosyltransferase involved in cell wall biosynthesis
MRLGILFPRLPPAFDAIGEHTHRLASSLTLREQTVVVSADPPPPGALYESARPEPGEGLLDCLPRVVAEERLECLVIQYNPFSYAHRGVGRRLRRAIHSVRRQGPATRIVLLVHERESDPDSIKLAILGRLHRLELARILPLCDMTISSTEAWGEFLVRLGARRVRTLAVGSNISVFPAGPRPAVQNGGKILIGTFGKPHNSKLSDWVAEAERATAGEADWLHIGPAGDRMSSGRMTGVVSESLASHHLQSLDVFVGPFRRGFSERRGSIAAALAHGLPVLTTIGVDTGPDLRSLNAKVYLAGEADDLAGFLERLDRLISTPRLRQSLGTEAASYYYRSLDWPVLAERLQTCLKGLWQD